MIDIESRKIIDIIETRETEKITEWLKGYSNLEIVSRDGSISYKNAITKKHGSKGIKKGSKIDAYIS